MHLEPRIRSLAIAASVASVVLAPLRGAAQESQVQRLECGANWLLEEDVHTLPFSALKAAPPPLRVQATQINLVAGAGLLANPQALAVWNHAIDIWESWLQDPVTLSLSANMVVLPPGVLGATSTRTFITGGDTYDDVRNQVVNDAEPDETIATQVPSAAQYAALFTPGFSWSGEMRAAKANFRALGFDMNFDDPNPDATINFSTGFAFDYDPSDGITPGTFDFEAIVIHEIGHAIGYTSVIDRIEQLRNAGTPGPVEPTPLDLFRLRPGDGAVNFTLNPRIQASGDTQPSQQFYDGAADRGLSTGALFGDGRQASHWKADELTGTHIGIMDPTIAAGARHVLTVHDIRATGLIGWDTAVDCNGNAIADAYEIAQGLGPDCNDNNVPDACDITSGLVQDCNANSVPDSCDIAAALVPDCNANAVPDSCDIASATSPDANGNGVPDECDPPVDVGDDALEGAVPEAYRLHTNVPNPFNPNTVIAYDLPEVALVTLRIYGVAGQLVRTLEAGTLRLPGVYRVTWNGRDDHGRQVSSGLYFYELAAGAHKEVRKMTLIR